ncbi:hypothetical protein [Bradyrhizobium sacchari]|uniref:Uncharacterized protein n=1 Tax=Bradyrhizobium sacchari TaxID=1399419 RepID=A0A560IFD0_9BRAD|nr:hypothetical protein [Bradyrhizobium sacchari]TWB56861.1 hypothetical protein FBZ94_106120 [Bradyrhizobium sacchari]TWB71138.1 hypothetical protein FBZ95_107120 [Bradyrhizobium sacchari]
MDSASRLRAMASLCRQTAAQHPDRSWKLLAEAEYWEHLANDASLDHFELRQVGSPLHGEGNITPPTAALAGRVHDRIVC